MKKFPQIFTTFVLPLVILIALVLGTGFLMPTVGATSVSMVKPALSIMTSDESGVEFVVKVDAGNLAVEEVEAGGKMYTQVSLPGWANSYAEGLPVLPVEVAQVGAPMGAEVEVIVSMGEARVVELSAPVLPGVKQVAEWGLPVEDENGPAMPEMVEVYEEDAAVYSGGVYPAALAEVSGDGMMRQQRVVGVSVFPVQYNAGTQELTVYETLTVTVRFIGVVTVESAGAGVESEAYEDIFTNMLLNYEEARGYRTAGMVESLAVESEVEGIGLDDAGSWTVPDPGWRVKVREDGMYKLTYEELELAGLEVESLNPGTLQMYNKGEEIAIGVELGGDSTFDAGDYVVFYGEGIESKYTLDNVYWLTYGKAAGFRMNLQDGTPTSKKVPTNYLETKHFEGGGYYRSYVPEFGDNEKFLWGRIYPSNYPTWTTTFTSSVPKTSVATLRVSLLGGFKNDSVNPDHHVVATLNGTKLGDVYFDGIIWHTAELSVPAGILKTGAELNTFVLTGPMDLGLTYDLVYIDWFDLEYPNTFIAENNGLAFIYTEIGTWKYQVSGFTSDQVQAYDVTNPIVPLRITNLSVIGTGSYLAEFQDDVTAPTRYWAGTSAGMRSVQGIEADTESTLKTSLNSADYIIISPPVFMNAATTLGDYRTAHGLRSIVVDIQNIYDEFSFGVTDAAAIHDFLAYAYANWLTPAPAYVVLMGDGNYDPKNFLKYGRTSHIPPYLLDVDPWIHETAADNRYVTVAGTDLMPDMMLGRLAVNSAPEADAVVSKIISYETTSPTGGWRQEFLAVADNPDAAGYFNIISDDLINCCVPPTVTTTRVYYGVTHSDTASARAAVLSSYGKFIVNYIGHGYSTGWASESLLTTSSVGSLANGGQQPIALVMACLEGYYINPNPVQDSLAEVTARAVNKGAIASWSATGQGDAGGHDYMNRAFLDAVYTSGVQTVGAATQAGKQALFTIGASPDLLDTYLLFGDPALRIDEITPTAVELLYFEAAYEQRQVVLTWETASELNNAGFNVYRSRTLDGVKKKLNTELIFAQHPGETVGASYTFSDANVKPRKRYFYWLESVDLNGMTTLEEPIKIRTVKK